MALPDFLKRNEKPARRAGTDAPSYEFPDTLRTDLEDLVPALKSAAPEAQPASPAQAIPEPHVDEWSPRIKMLCLLGGAAASWALVLAPVLLFV